MVATTTPAGHGRETASAGGGCGASRAPPSSPPRGRRGPDRRRIPARARPCAPVRTAPPPRRGAARFRGATETTRHQGEQDRQRRLARPTTPAKGVDPSLTAGGHGEWSDATLSMRAVGGELHHAPAVDLPADRRAAHRVGSDPPDVVLVECQVVGARLDRRAGPALGLEHASGDEQCTTWSRAPWATADAPARDTAATSEATGRSDPPPRKRDGSSQWTATGSPARPAAAMPRASVSASQAGNSGHPLSHRNALRPTTPLSNSGPRACAFSGTSPPQRAKSTSDAFSASSRFATTASARIVGGSESMGMSTTVVTPPAAAARLPVAHPSQSSRPGASKCTWASTAPGSRARPVASITLAAAPPAPGSVTATMVPSETTTSRGAPPSSPPRTISSAFIAQEVSGSFVSIE